VDDETDVGNAERAERLQDTTYPRYGIGVVTDLTGIPAQQLRRYEEAGLLKPHRTAGGTRQYSDADVVRLLEIGRLNEEGVNLPGIRHILRLRAQLAAAGAKRAPRAEDGDRVERGEDRRSAPPRRRGASPARRTPQSVDSPAEHK
jgi:MerR family transcriptional regulator/heat shock protein HspR